MWAECSRLPHRAGLPAITTCGGCPPATKLAGTIRVDVDSSCRISALPTTTSDLMAAKVRCNSVRAAERVTTVHVYRVWWGVRKRDVGTYNNMRSGRSLTTTSVVVCQHPSLRPAFSQATQVEAMAKQLGHGEDSWVLLPLRTL